MKYLICKDDRQEMEIMNALRELDTDCNGLKTFDALARQEEFGLNEFPTLSFDDGFIATVLRDGQWVELPAIELVPGDIIRLSKNEIVPADVVIITGEGLTVNEAIFTERYSPNQKHLLEKVYAGSVVLSGEATAAVSQTGLHTLLSNVITNYNNLNNQLYLS